MGPTPPKPFRATAMPDRDWWQTLWPDPGAVLAAVGVGAAMRAVDLCCGDGLFTVAMAVLVGDGHVFAVDIDQDLLAAAELESERAGTSNISFVQGDAMDLPELIPEPVDMVVIANSFHGAPDHTALGRAVHAVLAPGGSFAVINWWPRPREETTVLGKPRGPRRELRFSPDQVAVWLAPAGFRLHEVKEVGPYHYGAIFRAHG